MKFHKLDDILDERYGKKNSDSRQEFERQAFVNYYFLVQPTVETVG